MSKHSSYTFFLLSLALGLCAADVIDFNSWRAPGLGDLRRPTLPWQLPFRRSDAATYTPSSPGQVATADKGNLFSSLIMPSIQLPKFKFPGWQSPLGNTGHGGVDSTSSNPSSNEQHQTTPAPEEREPSQRESPTPRQESPTPGKATEQQPQTPASGYEDCSKTDTSPDAVLRCVNAVRTNPRAFTAGYNCDWQQWISNVSSPARRALKPAVQLTKAAAGHAEWMARNKQFSHVGEGGSRVRDRIAAAGWDQFPQAENIHCQLDSVGTAVSYENPGDSSSDAYYVQDFGCSRTNTCHC